MSEVASRSSASRGRGSGRGGRGGYAGRGGRRTNGDKPDHKADDSQAAFPEEGDFAELRKQYGDKTSVICEMFPDWSEIDVLYVLQETGGDQSEAVTRIAEGTVSQWDEVSKPKKTTRPKAKDTPAPSNPDPAASRNVRPGRNPSEPGRGRGRASERGGRGARGRSSHAPTNGSRGKENQPLSVPTEESPAYHEEKSAENAQEVKPVLDKPAPPPEPPKPAAPAKTWASMLRQSTAPKPAPVAHKEAPPAKPVESTADIKTQIEPQVTPIESQTVNEPEVVDELEPEDIVVVEAEVEVGADMVAEVNADTEVTPVAEYARPDAQRLGLPVDVPPSQAELTRTNLEQVVDDSKPPATDTAASTAADSWDPRQSPLPAAATPLSASQQQAQRAAASGYAATALKATGERGTRPPTFQRRVLDQEEAVRMPGNREVDRAAVQFGAFSLGEVEDDVDGEREDPETRAQPPPDSPIAHPRTSLPPAAQPVAMPDVLSQKATVTAPPPGMAPGIAQAAPGMTAQATLPPQASQPPMPSTQQFGRFSQAGPQDVSVSQQKPLDHFTHQQSAGLTQPPFDNYASQTSQAQAQQPGAAAYSSAPAEYSAYYTANQHDRNPYNFYGQHYSQQGAHGQLEPSQRPFGGYNASHTDSLSQYPQSGAGHVQPRFGANSGESQNSGHSTPNPAAQAQQQTQQQTQAQTQAQAQAQQQQAQQGQQQPQQQQQGAPGSQPQQTHGQQYPGYSHPYFSNPYYHNYYTGYGQGGFGPYGKNSMYGQPYGVSPNAPYESSPGAFGPSTLHRDTPLGTGLGDYGRAGTGQANTQPGLGGSTFGSGHDSFSRGAHSFQSQGQGFSNQTQPGAATTADELKPYGEASKVGSGPSPSIGGGPRPGSATNTGVPVGQSGSLPPQQSSQMSGAHAGYPSHLQGYGLHGSGAYGMGGVAGSQHSTPYGSYGQGGFSSAGYYGAGQQQQQQGQQGQQGQQRGGWGGNYH